MTQHDYPIYLVREAAEGQQPDKTGRFLIADLQFRKKKLRLEPSDHRIGFTAYTEGERLVVNVRYEHIESEGGDHGEVSLFFDRGNTRRKRHNMFAFRIKPDGQLLYEEHNYEVQFPELPPGIEFTAWRDGEDDCACFVIPLGHLRIHSPDDRIIGFNLVRTLSDLSKEHNNLAGEFISWSGIPGDRPSVGIGNGDLLLIRGLSAEEIAAWQEKTQTASDMHFTRWEKRWIPEEIYGLMTIKQRGCTGRLREEDVRRARQRAETTDWGRRMKEKIVEIADFWADKSDDELFGMVPVGNPRALSVGQYFGNPLHGGKRTAYELCLERPYQYYSPATRTWWYNGMTITNPGTGEKLELNDDGRGFLAPEGFPNPGVRYMFTASYRLFLLSMLLGTPYCAVLEDTEVCPETTGSRYAGAIPHLAFAYHLTGEKTYAYKALLLIGRIAELVPYMNENYGSGYYDTVQMSEPTTTESHWFSNLFDAMDLLFDAAELVQPELEAFFTAKPDAENRPRAVPFNVKQAIQEMIPFVLYSCEIERTRNSDWSLRYIYLELLIASYMGSGRLMNAVLNEGPYCLKGKVRNNFFRDGRYIYDSMGYIVLNCDQIAMLANNTCGFSDEAYFPEGIDLFENPDYGIKQVIELYSKLYSGRLTPMFGDTQANNTEPLSEDRKKGKFAYSPAFEIAYGRMPSIRPVLGPVLAQYDYGELADYRVESINESIVKHSLLLLATAGECDEYRLLDEAGTGIQPSFLLEDSETSMLRAGTTPHNCKHLMLYGQPSAGHMHGDKLGIWLSAYGYHLAAGVGSYPFTWMSPKFDAWEVHSAACTVTLVDGKNQLPSYSRMKCHYEGEWLQAAGMENQTAYPGSHVERWCLLVNSPGRENAYVVDLTYMASGLQFDYNTMGMDITFEQVVFDGVAEGDWIPMSGTLAGETVPLYAEHGYGWMKALRKWRTSGPVAWTYAYPGAAVKYHAVPAGNERELLCCLGEKGGQEMGKSRWVPFVLWRDSGDRADDHRALFTAVLEPYEDRPFLEAVRPLQVAGEANVSGFRHVGLEICHTDGAKDIIISVYDSSDGIVSFIGSDKNEYMTDARLLLLRYRGGALREVEAVGYSHISAGEFHAEAPSPAITGRVTGIDLERREVSVRLDSADGLDVSELRNQVALLDAPEYGKPSTYILRELMLEGDLLTFRSSMSLIRLDADWKPHFKRMGLGEKGKAVVEGREVLVDLKAGDSFRVHRSLRWSFPAE